MQTDQIDFYPILSRIQLDAKWDYTKWNYINQAKCLPTVVTQLTANILFTKTIKSTIVDD